MAVTSSRAATNGRHPQAGGPGRAPGGPSAPGATQRAATRNRTRIAVGTLVMIACALGIGILFATVADRSPVLVVAQPVRAGEVIEQGDLREQLVDSSASGSTIAASQRSAIVGRPAAVDLVAGSFLAPGQLAEGPTAGTGQAVIGATLKEGQYPIEISDGAKVLAVVLPSESADPAPTTTPSPTAATVVGIRPLDDGGGIAISLAVAPERSSALAIAGARSRLTIVLAPR